MVWCGSPSVGAALRSVSFDLDGTFADTSTDLAGALNALRVELGLLPLPVPDVARYVGRGARWLVSHCIDGDDDVLIDQRVQRFLDLYADCCTETTAPYAGLDDLVFGLRRAGVKVALATNKPRRFTEAIVTGLEWQDWFDSIHCGDDGPAKPDPAMIAACVQQLGTTAQMHLHIGDTPTDAHAAARAGCYFAACFWGMDGGAGLTQMDLQGFALPRDLIAAVKG